MLKSLSQQVLPDLQQPSAKLRGKPGFIALLSLSEGRIPRHLFSLPKLARTNIGNILASRLEANCLKFHCIHRFAPL